MKRLNRTPLIVGALLVTLLGGCGGSGGSPQTRDSKTGDRNGQTPVLTQQDCARLSDVLASELEIEETKPPSHEVSYGSSFCQLWTEYGIFSITLDTGKSGRKEFLQWVNGSRDSLPVARLGEARNGKAGAYWAPRLNRLFAYRRTGWLTLFVPDQMPNVQARKDEIRLAAAAFEISAE